MANFVKGIVPWNKGKIKVPDLNEIRTCKACDEKKNVTEFTKGKGHLYRYTCKACRQKSRRTGKISETRFKPGGHPGVEFKKGHTPWYKVKGVPPPSKGTGKKKTRDSAICKQWKIKVKERDNYTCVNCGSKNRVAAHHIVAWVDNESLRFDVDNGITLCCSCHAKEEGLGIKIRP